MSAHLAMPAYQAYPAGVGTGIKYGDYYWNCPGEMDSAPHKEAADADVAVPEPEEKPLPNPELSPASSSSGTLLRYTPDSATSPNAAPPSPHPAIRMGGGGSGGGVKKAKTRTAFSQEQLQTLHQRFQSQKYLSPQQIRELGSALGLTYKQVKTWFQNQRMKFKRCQKETQWMEKGTCLSQSGFHQAGYLDMNPSYHQGCPVSASRNIQTVTNVHQSYSSSNTYGSGQSLYPFMAIEEEGFFGKPGGACSAQQTMGFFSQQKVNLYHGYPANMDYASRETEDGYHFQNASVNAMSFPGSAGRQQYQPAWYPQGTQSNFNS
ncbi:homeobox protein NANOG [Pelodiscus sinensis]|uniref:Homeobox protein NANOG n=1 Tax=Pelodiscus sinensis TaxID=13735 RepID=K7G0C1_PELSI|nr:homeobox protein NANOG isoform X1 [Pelodiscus sinensis]|eukprot:XP_006119990.1 homeobox protein NANOG isoform X1 [Pelodiscus sinensis]